MSEPQLLAIVTDKNAPVLNSIAEPVAVVNEEIQQLVADMILTMNQAQGVGLAAPQVGVGKRLMICKLDGADTPMINPVVTSYSSETRVDEEGCLSLPGVWLNAARSQSVTVEFLDVQGEQQILHLSGFPARIVQHELDHLDGILLHDRNRQLEHAVAL
jgi:peptide deformylase